jgi:hypothetical protein
MLYLYSQTALNSTELNSVNTGSGRLVKYVDRMYACPVSIACELECAWSSAVSCRFWLGGVVQNPAEESIPVWCKVVD